MIPDPRDVPTVPLWPSTGQALGLGRTATYAAAERGDIPTIRIGRRIVVPTAGLRRLLMIDEVTPQSERSHPLGRDLGTPRAVTSETTVLSPIDQNDESP
jgi:hypothetical protein